MAEERGVKVQGLVHWSIPVNDLEESRRFYTEVLGMEDRGPVGAEMRCVRFGTTDVLLAQRREPAAVDGPRESPAHIAFRVSTEDFERAAANMRAWGVKVQVPAGPPDVIQGDV